MEIKLCPMKKIFSLDDRISKITFISSLFIDLFT